MTPAGLAQEEPRRQKVVGQRCWEGPMPAREGQAGPGRVRPGWGCRVRMPQGGVGCVGVWDLPSASCVKRKDSGEPGLG